MIRKTGLVLSLVVAGSCSYGGHTQTPSSGGFQQFLIDVGYREFVYNDGASSTFMSVAERKSAAQSPYEGSSLISLYQTQFLAARNGAKPSCEDTKSEDYRIVCSVVGLHQVSLDDSRVRLKVLFTAIELLDAEQALVYLSSNPVMRATLISKPQLYGEYIDTVSSHFCPKLEAKRCHDILVESRSLAVFYHFQIQGLPSEIAPLGLTHGALRDMVLASMENSDPKEFNLASRLVREKLFKGN